jgi:hypothetical protein
MHEVWDEHERIRRCGYVRVLICVYFYRLSTEMAMCVGST